jgi:hypothetical protein
LCFDRTSTSPEPARSFIRCSPFRPFHRVIAGQSFARPRKSTGCPQLSRMCSPRLSASADATGVPIAKANLYYLLCNVAKSIALLAVAKNPEDRGSARSCPTTGTTNSAEMELSSRSRTNVGGQYFYFRFIFLSALLRLLSELATARKPYSGEKPRVVRGHVRLWYVMSQLCW